jgi:hypothetical protein
MRFLRILLGALVLVAHLDAQVQSKRSDTSLGINRQPVIYVVAAGPQSEKFSRQIRLLSERSDITLALRLVVVPDTTTFLTMGWPPGLLIQKPDQRMREVITKRFGSIEGKHELLIVLVDGRGLVKTVSHDPITAEKLRALLSR